MIEHKHAKVKNHINIFLKNNAKNNANNNAWIAARLKIIALYAI